MADNQDVEEHAPRRVSGLLWAILVVSVSSSCFLYALTIQLSRIFAQAVFFHLVKLTNFRGFQLPMPWEKSAPIPSGKFLKSLVNFMLRLLTQGENVWRLQ